MPREDTRKVSEILKSLPDPRRLTYKEKVLLKMLETITVRDKVVVFTEYVSTLRRLMKVLGDMDIKYTYISGALSLTERKHAINTFWRDPRVRVLLATDAAGEGINLQVARYQINYDIPWSPIKLEQRFGRVHRYGMRRPVILYNLAMRGTIDERVMARILEKLEKIAKLLGDWVYDYIGTAVTKNDVLEAIKSGNADSIKEEAMKARLEEVKKDLHSPRLQDPERIRRTIVRLRALASRMGIETPTKAIYTSNHVLNVLRRLETPNMLVGTCFDRDGKIVAFKALKISEDHFKDPVAWSSKKNGRLDTSRDTSERPAERGVKNMDKDPPEAQK